MTTRNSWRAGLDQLGPVHGEERPKDMGWLTRNKTLAHRIHVSQALRRKRPVTLPKVNLDRD
jgi:hypothetical protein